MKLKIYTFIVFLFTLNQLAAMEIEQQQQLFFYAAECGDVDLFTQMLQFPINVNITNTNNETAFMRAALNGQVNIIRAIRNNAKAQQFNPNMQDLLGNHALILAASVSTDNDEMINELLLFPGTQITLKNNCGMTVLSVAAKAGRIRILNQLLHNPHVKTIVNHENGDGATPLILAIDWSQPNATRILLDNDWVDVNYTNKYDDTALIMAARRNNIEILDAVLNCARLNLTFNNQGQRALETAKKFQNASAVKLIRDKLNLLSLQ